MKKTNELLENAKSLRKTMTKQEKHLWYDFLCKYPIKMLYYHEFYGNMGFLYFK